MRLRTRAGRVVLVTALVIASFASAGSSFAFVETMGPQAMEGDLRVDPGDVIRAGISFTMPGSHPEATVQFDTAVTFWGVECVTGWSDGGDILVPMGKDGLIGPFLVPRNDSSWFPTGDQSSDASYQGSVAAPDLCNGGTMTLRNGATLQADMQSDRTSSANVRFHYSANGSSGSWSATRTFTPSPLPGSQVPGGGAGVLILAVIAGSTLVARSRTQPRHAVGARRRQPLGAGRGQKATSTS